MLQDNYLTENSDPNSKQKVKTLEIENKFLRNDIVSKQNLVDSLLDSG